MRKLLASLSLLLAVVIAVPGVAFAHVVVTPAQAGVGSRTTFSVSVPNEKEVDVTGMRLVIPDGLDSVSPTVHPGWTIETSKDSKQNVTEIRWSGGTIPAGQRDDFTFRAQTPADKTSLAWKAYQTYADGTTVSWDQKPDSAQGEEGGNSGPYSVTEVVNDLDDDNSASSTTTTASDNHSSMLSFVISLAALALSVVALTRQRKSDKV